MTMQMNEIEIAEFGIEHLDGALRLTAQAGWPHRRVDWAKFIGLGSGYVALMDGHVVGAICITRFGDVAAINILMVDEKMRGRGLGGHLMKLALEKADGRECRLVSTTDGLPLYRKLGFREIGTITQHQGTVAPVNTPDGVEWAMRGDIDQIINVDRIATGMDRRALLSTLWDEARFAVIRNSDETIGYAALRPFWRGELAGPVVARSSDEAQRLLSFLFSNRTGAFLRVDLLPQSRLADWLNSIGLTETGRGIAMCRDEVRVDAPRPFHTYAVASQAFG